MIRIKNGRPKTPDQYNWHFDNDGEISETFTAPTRLRVLQLTIHWDSVPSTSELFVVTKDSIWGAEYDVDLYAVDPSASGENIEDLVCVYPWIFERLDQCVFTYTNTDEQDVAFEMMLEEIIDNRDNFTAPPV